MKSVSKWSPIGHSHTLPTDEPTHRRVMLAARARMVDAGEDGDIRAAMAEYVGSLVANADHDHEWQGPIEVREVDLRTFNDDLLRSMGLADLTDLTDPEKLRAHLEGPGMFDKMRAFADGTEPGTAKVSPDGGEWMWRDKGPTR